MPAWWEGAAPGEEGVAPYPMDYYAKDGGVWNSSYHKKKPQRASQADNPLVAPHERASVREQGPAVGA